MPLKNVFETIASSTGRKPNSVRNFYYATLKAKAAPPEIATMRVLPFTPFRDEEVLSLLRKVLTARAQGVSVRACVLSLADGDRSLMLRYQNKYRAVLRTQPTLVSRIVEELRAEGIPCPDPCTDEDTMNGGARVQDCEPLYQSVLDDLRLIGDEEAARFLGGLRGVTRLAAQRAVGRRRVEENDRQNVRINLLRLELMRKDEALLDARVRCEEAYSALLPLVCSVRSYIEESDPDALPKAQVSLRPAEQALDTLYNDVMAVSQLQ